MTEIYLPYRPRPEEDPTAAGVVQANLDYLASLFQRGANDGETLVWDAAAGKYVSQTVGLPAGLMFPYAGATAPVGYIMCLGQAVSRTTYAALFAAIGTSYGAGDGSTTFNVPDLQGRMPVGKGSHADVDALGDNDGVSAVGDRRPKHAHTVTDPGHTHSVLMKWGSGANGNPSQNGNNNDISVVTSSSTTGISVGPTVNRPVDGPAYVVVNYVIKY